MNVRVCLLNALLGFIGGLDGVQSDGWHFKHNVSKSSLVCFVQLSERRDVVKGTNRAGQLEFRDYTLLVVLFHFIKTKKRAPTPPSKLRCVTRLQSSQTKCASQQVGPLHNYDYDERRLQPLTES